jgi:hypothetical protein
MQIVRRKWGIYITLLDRKHFKVKLLRFKKGGQLSTQYHHLRSELWCFLTGECAGDYMRIDQEAIHTWYARKPAWVLEIQYGEKCIEEDIVRL